MLFNNKKVIIETERLVLTEPDTEDFDALLIIYRKENNMRFIQKGKYDWTLPELKEKYQELTSHYPHRFGFWMVHLKTTGQLIGEGGFLKTKNPKEVLEVGYMLDENHWRQGLGTEICSALIDYGTNQLKLKRMVAGTWKENVASQQVLQKCGMIFRKEITLKNGTIYKQFELICSDEKQAYRITKK